MLQLVLGICFCYYLMIFVMRKYRLENLRLLFLIGGINMYKIYFFMEIVYINFFFS